MIILTFLPGDGSSRATTWPMLPLSCDFVLKVVDFFSHQHEKSKRSNAFVLITHLERHNTT
jgi:hypothetical protein